MKACETHLRTPQGKLCQLILGLDANALYLYAIGQKMPHGCYSRLIEKDGVLVPLHRNARFAAMYIWMDFMSTKEEIVIKHKFNSNREVRIGPYLVDGYHRRPGPSTR